MENYLSQISNDSTLELLNQRFSVWNAITRMESQPEMSRANAMLAYKKDQLFAIETEIKSRFESNTFITKLESVDAEIHYNSLYALLQTIEDTEKELKYMLTTEVGTYESSMGRGELESKQEIVNTLNIAYKAYLKYTK